MPCPSMKATMSSFTVVRSSGVEDILKKLAPDHCMLFANSVPARAARESGSVGISLRTPSDSLRTLRSKAVVLAGKSKHFNRRARGGNPRSSLRIQIQTLPDADHRAGVGALIRA